MPPAESRLSHRRQVLSGGSSHWRPLRVDTSRGSASSLGVDRRRRSAQGGSGIRIPL